MLEDQQPNTSAVPWQANLDEIKRLESMLQDIDARLGSISLNLKEMFALGAEDLAEERYLFIESNDKLSKKDLSIKKDTINAMIDQKRAEIAAMQAQARQTLLNTHQAQMKQNAAIIKKNSDMAVQAYKKNPLAFFAEVLNIEKSGPDFKKILFASADKIIAACPYFTDTTEDAHLWAAWKIVGAARDLAARDFRENLRQNENTDNQNKTLTDSLFKTNEHYVNGAKRLFQVLLNRLPKAFIGLQFLYDVNSLERVQYYLQLIYANKDEKYSTEVMNNLTRDVDDASERQARRILAPQAEFKSLSAQSQQALLKQQKYLLNLIFDVYKLPSDLAQPIEPKINDSIQILKSCIKRCQSNIDNALKRTITMPQNAAEDLLIRSDADGHWQRLRMAAGLENASAEKLESLEKPKIMRP